MYKANFTTMFIIDKQSEDDDVRGNVVSVLNVFQRSELLLHLCTYLYISATDG